MYSTDNHFKNVPKNQIVKYDGDYYYINNVGTARQFSATAWTGRDKTSCPSATTKTITDEQMNQLSRGTTMGIGEICRSGGWNAKDRGSGTTAWVDNNGQADYILDDNGLPIFFDPFPLYKELSSKLVIEDSELNQKIDSIN